MGYAVNGSSEYVTLDGSFTMKQDGDGIFIKGESANTSGGGDNNTICIEINGHLLNDISTAISNGPVSCD